MQRSGFIWCGWHISAAARVAALDGDWLGHVHANQGAEGLWLRGAHAGHSSGLDTVATGYWTLERNTTLMTRKFHNVSNIMLNETSVSTASVFSEAVDGRKKTGSKEIISSHFYLIAIPILWRTWLHGFTSHLKVQTCTKQGTVMAGLTAAWQFSSATMLSLPWINWTQDTTLWATPRSQETEQGNVLNTFHLAKWQWWGVRYFFCCCRNRFQVCILCDLHLAGQLWVLHDTTAVGLGKLLHSESSTTTSSPSASRAQYSTLFATPPPHVTLQTPCLERHLVVTRKISCNFKTFISNLHPTFYTSLWLLQCLT